MNVQHDGGRRRGTATTRVQQSPEVEQLLFLLWLLLFVCICLKPNN